MGGSVTRVWKIASDEISQDLSTQRTTCNRCKEEHAGKVLGDLSSTLPGFPEFPSHGLGVIHQFSHVNINQHHLGKLV